MVSGGLLRLFVGFDTEGSVPVARGVPLDADLFDGRVLGDFSVVRYRYLPDFAQPKPVPAGIGFDELESALAVGKRLVPARPFPSERADLVPVLLLRGKPSKVGVQTLYDDLKNLRVDLFQFGPLPLQFGKSVLWEYSEGTSSASLSRFRKWL